MDLISLISQIKIKSLDNANQKKQSKTKKNKIHQAEKFQIKIKIQKSNLKKIKKHKKQMI